MLTCQKNEWLVLLATLTYTALILSQVSTNTSSVELVDDFEPEDDVCHCYYTSIYTSESDPHSYEATKAVAKKA